MPHCPDARAEIGDACEPERPPYSPIEEVAEFFAQGPSTAEIARFQLSDAGQSWISQLLDKEDAGTLTREEHHTLDELLIIQDLVNLIRSRIPPSPATGKARRRR